MQSEAKCIFEICVQHGISIEPEWLPRSSNEQADYLSRIVDLDDWSVSPHIFRFLDLKWGPHSIDRFADEHNHLFPRFDSSYGHFYLGVGLRQQLGLSTTSPSVLFRVVDSEAHEVLLRPRYFDHSALAFCSILAFSYNGLIWPILLKIGWTCLP